MKKADLFIIVFFLVLAGVLYAFQLSGTEDGYTYAEIYIDGKYNTTLSLNEDITYIPPDRPQVKFEIKKGEVAFIESDCPDKVCINTGFISKAGQTAVCLPNGISVVIRSSDAATPDTVA